MVYSNPMNRVSYLLGLVVGLSVCGTGCAPVGCSDDVEFLADFNADTDQELSLTLCIEQQCALAEVATPSADEDFLSARFEGNDVVVRRLASKTAAERFSLVIELGRDLLLDAEDGDVLSVEVKDAESGTVVFSHQEALDLNESRGCKGGAVGVSKAE